MVSTPTKSPAAPTKEQVETAIQAIFEVLGEPSASLHQEALKAFQEGDFQRCKRLAATHLSDNYCKALSYLGGALKLTPNTDTILAEAARAAAEFNKEDTLKKLGDAIAQAMG
jgi:hypothetical protein